MIYCGSGSDFEKVPIPVPAPVLVPDPGNLSAVFQQEFFLYTKSRLFVVKSSIISQEVGLSFLFFDLFNPILCWIRIQIQLQNRIWNLNRTGNAF
jgi:hypothetical protein